MSPPTMIEGPLEFDFRSERSGEVYRMRITPGGIECSCGDRFTTRQRRNCYHRDDAQKWLTERGIIVVHTLAQREAIFARFDRSPR